MAEGGGCLKKRREEALHPVGEEAVEKVHAKGQADREERIYALLERRFVRRTRRVAKHRSKELRDVENNRTTRRGRPW